jgi:hypothetical protein
MMMPRKNLSSIQLKKLHYSKSVQLSKFIFEVFSFKSILTDLIQAYRSYISPLLPPNCRFQPSCSYYGLEAIEKV